MAPIEIVLASEYAALSPKQTKVGLGLIAATGVASTITVSLNTP